MATSADVLMPQHRAGIHGTDSDRTTLEIRKDIHRAYIYGPAAMCNDAKRTVRSIRDSYILQHHKDAAENYRSLRSNGSTRSRSRAPIRRPLVCERAYKGPPYTCPLRAYIQRLCALSPRQIEMRGVRSYVKWFIKSESREPRQAIVQLY